MMNRGAWDRLPQDLKDIVYAACITCNNHAPAEYFARNAESLPILVNKHGVKIRNYPQDIITQMYKISRDVLEETAQEDSLTNRVYSNWSKFQQLSMDYQPLSNYGFIKDRSKAYN